MDSATLIEVDGATVFTHLTSAHEPGATEPIY
jgi:hypothetical protein